MRPSTLESVIREREQKNERIVAWFRAAMIGMFCVLDTLSFTGFLPAYQPAATAESLGIDYLFVAYAVVAVAVARRKAYAPWLKYLTITVDAAFGVTYVIVDATLRTEGEFGVGLLLVLLLVVLNMVRHSPGASLYTAAIGSVIFVVMQGVWQPANLVMYGICFGLILAIGAYVTGSTGEILREANTKALMERYLAPQLVSGLYDAGNSLEPGGEKRVVTVLFSDIRGFTSTAERMSAQELVSLLNAYLEAMTEVVFEHQGTLDKFIGDAVMVFYGAPLAREDDALRAVRTAVDMCTRLKAFNIEQAVHPSMEMGIGVHTGSAIVGNIGSERRLDYTVIGDSVNVSSRVEGLTKHLQCPILITSGTRDAIPDDLSGEHFVIRDIGSFQVMGRRSPVSLFAVEPLSEEDGSAQRETFARALELFRARDFERAGEAFETLPDAQLNALYVRACKDLAASPPDEGWLPAIVMGEK